MAFKRLMLMSTIWAVASLGVLLPKNVPCMPNSQAYPDRFHQYQHIGCKDVADDSIEMLSLVKRSSAGPDVTLHNKRAELDLKSGHGGDGSDLGCSQEQICLDVELTNNKPQNEGYVQKRGKLFKRTEPELPEQEPKNSEDRPNSDKASRRNSVQRIPDQDHSTNNGDVVDPQRNRVQHPKATDPKDIKQSQPEGGMNFPSKNEGEGRARRPAGGGASSNVNRFRFPTSADGPHNFYGLNRFDYRGWTTFDICVEGCKSTRAAFAKAVSPVSRTASYPYTDLKPICRVHRACGARLILLLRELLLTGRTIYEIASVGELASNGRYLEEISGFQKE